MPLTESFPILHRASKDEAISDNKCPLLCFIDQHFPLCKNLGFVA